MPAPEQPASEAAGRFILAQARPAPPGVHDELRGPQGQLRPAWAAFFGELGPQGLAGLPRRATEVQAQILRDGVTHNVYAAAGGGQDRPWSLGLLPWLIEARDWQSIEAGVAQRARLLERLLDDAYGDQALLAEGLLPAALVLGHPGFLHGLRGLRPPGGVRLHLTAFDLARDPSGRWWVTAQRSQAPSGLGYVMQNRLIASRAFAEPFRELRVQHLASSYRALVDTLDAQAVPIARAAGDGPPRLALWTPGPYNETYFEHAYLARYLGLPLVEGADLTVRGERLFRRTVEGLEPIHGLLRRLDDDWCDPLELRPESALGVAGLLKVLRAGQLLMANALGAGFLESPAIAAFLPGVAERLLGEPLALPSMPSWWCGEAAAWADARPRLDACVIRPSYPDGRSFEPVAGASLDAEARAAWEARIDADPDAYTLQVDPPTSQVPVWGPEGGLEPRPAMLRVYAIADGRGGHRIVPGGMARVASAAGQGVSMQRGGLSLDTWVLTEGAVDTFSMLPPPLKARELASHRRPVASRTAENLFWLGRYTERCEHLVRTVQALAVQVAEDEELPPPVMEAITVLARALGLVPGGLPSMALAPRVFERTLAQALGDARGASSLAFNLAALARSAAGLRERLAPESSRLVRAMAADFSARLAGAGGPGLSLGGAETLAALDHLALQLAALTGAQTDRMTRDHGWRLLSVGRLLERLLALTAQLRAFVGQGAWHHAAGFDLLLGLADSTLTYRARYQGRLEPLALLALLVMDETNPRALACVLRRLRTELGKLPEPAQAAALPPGMPAHAPLLALLPAEGVGLPLEALSGPGAAQADAGAVIALCERLGQAAAALSDALGQRYFAVAGRQEHHIAG